MTEVEKMKAGLEYSFSDPELIARKGRAIEFCEGYNRIKGTDYAAQYDYLKDMLARQLSCPWRPGQGRPATGPHQG